MGFWLEYTRRPWTPTGGSSLTGTAGVLWYANFVFRSSELDVGRFWASSYLDQQRLAHHSIGTPAGGGPSAQELLVHVLQPYPSSLTVTFSAVDDPAAVADAIGACFSAALSSASRPHNLE